MKKWIVVVLILLLGGAGVGLYRQYQRNQQLEQALSESQEQLARAQHEIKNLKSSTIRERDFTRKHTSALAAFRQSSSNSERHDGVRARGGRVTIDIGELFNPNPRAGELEKTESNTVTVNLTSTPENTELLPTLNSPSQAKNRLWVGTFQLVWNDLMDELVKGPVKIQAPMAQLLNQKAFTTADLSDSAYYKKWGKASPTLRKEIEQGIKDKFNETSDIIGTLDWNQPEDSFSTRYILYAMLKKDFSFVEPLDKLKDGEFKGSNELIKYFGINDDTAYRVRESVHVLFYNDKNDFAVMLKSKQGDEVYLYRTNDNKTLDRLYADMLHKDKHTDDHIKNEDYFKAPMIDFKILREFTEVTGQEFPLPPEIGESVHIEKAVETAQFKMDETGVRIKSEAAIQMMALDGVGHAMPVVQHRYFYLDDSYVIFIKESGKKPYFAMRVTDAKALQ